MSVFNRWLNASRFSNVMPCRLHRGTGFVQNRVGNVHRGCQIVPKWGGKCLGVIIMVKMLFFNIQTIPCICVYQWWVIPLSLPFNAA